MIDLPDYSMYTDQGDVVADKIVALSQAAGLNWTQTLSIMRFIADQNPDQYGELMDTAVREIIYDRREYTTDFYV
jgi:enamine deaminase RidA (YjgF/YER057c/UK114 family)